MKRFSAEAMVWLLPMMIVMLLSACSAQMMRRDEIVAQCRNQALKDTTSVPGPAPNLVRDLLFQACMKKNNL
ncbi:hypothetical protein [Granulibacter bethesdensis]|uniref:hypothetical protein n=1 Tax=Granulibacter bethesdensis TaxID=364410 RepID=UPI0009328225|nr:hypothetical protein [Granulibacter bethesdensis]